ncbi:hypothetical protein Ddc_11606 [Ditylenchus destructor]|nr:hypothetical protein Ddc_11606 [Ditylenchus destructor]
MKIQITNGTRLLSIRRGAECFVPVNGGEWEKKCDKYFCDIHRYPFDQMRSFLALFVRFKCTAIAIQPCDEPWISNHIGVIESIAHTWVGQALSIEYYSVYRGNSVSRTLSSLHVHRCRVLKLYRNRNSNADLNDLHCPALYKLHAFFCGITVDEMVELIRIKAVYPQSDTIFVTTISFCQIINRNKVFDAIKKIRKVNLRHYIYNSANGSLHIPSMLQEAD